MIEHEDAGDFQCQDRIVDLHLHPRRVLPSGRARRGYFLSVEEVLMNETSNIRVSFFIDGQNFFDCVKKAFGYRYPNYDIKNGNYSDN